MLKLGHEFVLALHQRQEVQDCFTKPFCPWCTCIRSPVTYIKSFFYYFNAGYGDTHFIGYLLWFLENLYCTFSFRIPPKYIYRLMYLSFVIIYCIDIKL
jgi:hypothetical protein